MAMDSIDVLPVSRPLLPIPSASAGLRGPRRARTQRSPQCAGARGEKPRRASPLTLRPLPTTNTTATAAKPTTTTTTRWISRTLTRGASTASKPLLPPSERRYRQGKRDVTLRSETDTGTGDIAPDGTSAGREGRQFAVSNVGNNGRIYLRPSVRPAHQRYPQPKFTFPITPPSTAVMDSWSQSNKPKYIDTTTTTTHIKKKDGAGAQTPPWTPTTSATPLPQHHDRQLNPDEKTSSRPRRRRRAMSDSTIPEARASRHQDSHIFKIAISAAHGRDEHRPRTMDDLGAIASPPLLDVNIPSWRLGTPRFTLRGTPMLRGSSYAPTDDIRSSSASCLNSSSVIAYSSVRGGLSARRANDALGVPTPRIPLEAAQQRGAALMLGPQTLRLSRATHMSGHAAIEPAMFTELTFKPFCDDRLIVRYSSVGAVTAATPSRLVAEITSPSFLDYELLSDFFLTFRSFLEPSDLLRMLVARLRWALDRVDEVGMIVRVRTFVALRHWILNYFMDDFIVEYGLRITFCNLLNDFVAELSQDACSRRVQLKILAELKKCWRRVCAQYWDGDEFDDCLGPEVAITPGGVAGSRDPHLDPASAPDTLSREPDQRYAVTTAPSPCHQHMNANHLDHLGRDVPNTINVGDFVVLDNRPATPQNQTSGAFNRDESPTSPYSLASMDVVSCSFPGKHVKASDQNAGHQMGAHPVRSNAVGNTPGTIATTPKALVGKRVRPTQTHKRNNSITDSLREHQSDQASGTDQESSTALHSGGRLVRGNLLPPGQAVVDVDSSERSGHANRQTTVFRPKGRGYPKDGSTGGAMSGHGMRKMLRSVRHALTHRGHGLYSTSQALADIQTEGPRGATLNRLPGTAVVPQNTVRQNGTRPPVRIDLLGAEVAEDFKKAIREEEEEAANAAAAAAAAAATVDTDADAQHSTRNSLQTPTSPAPLVSSFAEKPASQMDWDTIDALTHHNEQRPFSDMAITVGSKSLVIVDDTMPFQMPSTHHGIYDAENVSVDTFGDSYAPDGVDLTPPNTPPSLNFDGGTPRRSSFLLNQHVIRPTMAEDVLPRVIPDLAALEGYECRRSSEDDIRSFVSATRPCGKLPFKSYKQRTYRCHRRGRSSKSQRSLDSVLHCRVTSLDDVRLSSALLDLKETTDSEELDGGDASHVTMPKPLHVLRRRPGGDLKAATNIGDLNRYPLRRSHSAGSILTYTESIGSSYMLSSRTCSPGEFDGGSASGGQGHLFSVGQLAERPKKRPLSLLSTQSVKLAMRPSFEAEAQKLAQIPDDEDDGIESALLKLEGKYPAKKTIHQLSFIGQSPRPAEDVVVQVDRNSDDEPRSVSDRGSTASSYKMPKQATVQGEPIQPVLDEASSPTWDVAMERLAHEARPPTRLSLSASEGSHDSYCSIPLLQRDPDMPRFRPASRLWTAKPIFRGSDDEESNDEPSHMHYHDASTGEAHSSFALIHKTGSIEQMGSERNVPSVSRAMEDALFSKHDSADGRLLSALSVRNEGTDDAQDDIIDIFNRTTMSQFRPVSPGITLAQALALSPEENAAPDRSDSWPKKPSPPTPAPTPVLGYSESPRSTAELFRGGEPPSKPAAPTTPKHSVHLPFILAFDSCVLAQQFTLIEKDALTEIDWRELIDMNWRHFASSNARSWVDFLRNIDAQGVDVVIARFNIMVKWAISEIVLTQHIEERARCIIKLIHIAAHCRQYRNFATLAQLTIALSSNEVSRLSKTWDLVPEADLKTLHDLEVLVTPSRNFHKMREEMEVGSSGGCIPFVGIYTHDLLYNAQRPAEIAVSSARAPLVNFERCRMGAAVVKTLLRLLEASTRYAFKPIEGVTERCLWIGALSDDEIRRYSRDLE
ncbi:hypothetical protein E4U44_006016 [Claviceps purpurea]|nr:hypothetical protein E4U44_006016 [Claviceps purpurea]